MGYFTQRLGRRVGRCTVAGCIAVMQWGVVALKWCAVALHWCVVALHCGAPTRSGTASGSRWCSRDSARPSRASRRSVPVSRCARLCVCVCVCMCVYVCVFAVRTAQSRESKARRWELRTGRALASCLLNELLLHRRVRREYVEHPACVSACGNRRIAARSGRATPCQSQPAKVRASTTAHVYPRGARSVR